MTKLMRIKVWLAWKTKYIPIPFIQRYGGRVIGRQLAAVITQQVEMYKEVMDPKGIYSTMPPTVRWVMSMWVMTSMVYISTLLHEIQTPAKEVNNASV